ncbi:MAG: tRNA (adenosine(37)-N6)-threonylcarbamoyltransferase complex dimerization subunit type 1 TsaB [Rhodobacteraceae bacterium]|nr:tRNA (adenosine(37)-N6)-threonylcarbamoyltransferase complex dimerization subunit type 1 TsaB [Paracoccaceae bacterium]
MTTLTFDTSGPFCAVHAGTGPARVEWMKTGQAEQLFLLIQAALADAGVKRGDITRICAGIGPGNFTGTRISVAAARGLALSLGCPAVGVSRLEALLTLAPHRTAAVAAYADNLFIQVSGGGPAIMHRSAVAGQEIIVDDSFPHQSDAHVVPLSKILPTMAGIATARQDAPPPAPLYLRGPGAVPPRELPPKILP